MNDDKCVGEKKETTLNCVLTELESAVAMAGRIADHYRDTIGRIDEMFLESDKDILKPIQEKTKGTPSTDNFLMKLRALVTRLEISNRKNNEILEKLNDLI